VTRIKVKPTWVALRGASLILCGSLP
jgi:hypothetical protein